MSFALADLAAATRFGRRQAHAEPSRSACWPAAAGSRSCSPRRPGGKGCRSPASGIRYEAPDELRDLCASFESSASPSSAG